MVWSVIQSQPLLQGLQRQQLSGRQSEQGSTYSKQCLLCFLTFIEFYLLVIQSYTFENNVLTVQNIKILNLAQINSKAAVSVFPSSCILWFAVWFTFGRKTFRDHVPARITLSSMGYIIDCGCSNYSLLPSFYLHCRFLFLFFPVSPLIRHSSSFTFPSVLSFFLSEFSLHNPWEILTFLLYLRAASLSFSFLLLFYSNAHPSCSISIVPKDAYR